MTNVSGGVVHTVPKDVRNGLLAMPRVRAAWERITPLARNEWLCWITSAKKIETRNRRMRIMHENLQQGKHRPCCWAGCPHR